MDFILNEEIAKDMYPDLEGMLLDLVKSLCSMLDYYKVYNKEKTIFSGVIHDNGEAEVTLSKGLGKYIDPYTKNQIIFDHGKFALPSWIVVQRKLNEKVTVGSISKPLH